MKTLRYALPLLVLTLGACSDDPSEPALQPEPTLVDVAISVNESTGEFSTLIAALVAADLVDAIAAPGQLTVFAPTDAAFAELGLDATSVAALPIDALTNILLYHVAPDRRTAASVLASESLPMLNGGTTAISLRDGVPYINESVIVQTDVLASNGVLHVIDAVLLPPAEAAAESASAVESGPALAKLGKTAKAPTLVDVAISVNQSTGEFSTLIAALVAADLVDAVAAPGQRTVFAPTDAAFAALGLDATSVATLPKDALTNILLYHLVPGRRTAADVLASDRLRMLNRGTTTISVQDGVAYINESAIIQTDVMASNGIIHVIDAVLLP